MTRKYLLIATEDTVDTLEELSEVLGEDVKEEDILAGGKYSDLVTIINPELQEIDKDTIYETVTEEVEVSPKDIEKAIPDFDTLEELKEFISDLDMITLEYMAKGLGLEWKPTYHSGIHRMRVAMAMHRYFFPELFEKQESDTDKKPAKYGDLTTDELEEIASKEGIEWVKGDNRKLNRIAIISALKESGYMINNR